MGEQSISPNQNGMAEEHDSSEEMDESEDYDDDDVAAEDFNLIDSHLDELNSALDDIEQKNANIQEQLLELLQSNKEIRMQMQLQNTDNSTNSENKPAA